MPNCMLKMHQMARKCRNLFYESGTQTRGETSLSFMEVTLDFGRSGWWWWGWFHNRPKYEESYSLHAIVVLLSLVNHWLKLRGLGTVSTSLEPHSWATWNLWSLLCGEKLSWSHRFCSGLSLWKSLSVSSREKMGGYCVEVWSSIHFGVHLGQVESDGRQVAVMSSFLRSIKPSFFIMLWLFLY